MQPTNMLYIISDQHTRDVAGCYGHRLIQTPNLDRLAERGTRFTRAYTNCAICVPARASLATGRYVYDIGYWDNAHPYDGTPASWHHRLREQGLLVDCIGKQHFRGQGSDHGFSNEIEPLNVVDGVGDVLGCIRDNPPVRAKRDGITGAGPGDSTYLRYDQRNADNACRWLRDHANDDKPWTLFLSFVCPHPPYIAPPDLYDRYPLDDVVMMPEWQHQDWPDHPAIRRFHEFFGFAEAFDEATVRKMIAAYYGTTTWLDQKIGQVLNVLAETGQEATTRVAYTSDHGEHMGARGIFGKFTMYEESAAVPFILAGPDVPAGKVSNTPISLVDSHPTILDAVGAAHSPDDADLPGQSLWEIANAPDVDRTVFSEYHAVGSRDAFFMLRDSQYKYVHYTYDAPQLFDLDADPNEVNDLAGSTEHQSVVADFEQRLRAMIEPEAVDAQAKASQRAKVEEAGGEEAVRARGYFVNSPTPDEAPAFNVGG